MCRIQNEFTFPDILTWVDVEWDALGFRARGGDHPPIRWKEVLAVAVVYEIHPIAIVDHDHIGFRLTDATTSVWVAVEKNEAFVAEIERRFARTQTPRMADWRDKQGCIRSYTLWPAERADEPLYVNRRRSWWSWSRSLALPKWNDGVH